MNFNLFKTKENLKSSIHIILNLIFWIAVFCILLINFYAAGSVFAYEQNHDHHLAFFAYLGAMAKEGILPGIDFYSPHSVFIPIVLSVFFSVFGVGQISLGISVGIIVFITMIFIYKCARFVMPSAFAKFAIITLLLCHNGKDFPWFNDVIMLFVAMAIYFFALYFKLDKISHKKICLIIIGIIAFMLPYLRQQGIVISFALLAMPMILFYTKQITDFDKKIMLKFIISSFLIANILFFVFIILRNGFGGLEILWTSFGTLVDMAQPAIAYENTIASVADSIFNYTADGIDWHGYSMKYLSYWFIVIIPCFYFLYQPLKIRFGLDSSVSNENIIRFITSLIVLSTIVFNYPVNEDARMKVQFGLGIWLFIDVLRLCFYHKNIKLFSILFISIVFLSIHHSKITQFIQRFQTNYTYMFHIRDNHQKMPSNSPYKNMIFRDDYALHLNELLLSIEDYHRKNPNTKIIFNGELVNISNYLFLLFSGPEVGIAHKFPYYYGTFDRKSVFSDMDEEFDKYLRENKPMILDCEFTKENLPDNYKILNKINDACNILIPKEDKGA